MFLIIDPCTWDVCYGDFGLAPDEFHEMCGYLVANAIAYMIMGLYLHQVVPQTYGVPKHPLFFLESFL